MWRLAQLPQNDKIVLVYSTFPSPEKAQEVGSYLVDSRLAACVNIIPGMVSVYRWQGERQRESEAVMIIKTRKGLADRVIAETRSRHPYANPALLVLGVESGSEDFLRWVRAETSDIEG